MQVNREPVYGVVCLLDELPQLVLWRKAALSDAITERVQIPQRRQELLACFGGLLWREAGRIHWRRCLLRGSEIVYTMAQ
jgi:hypothetical protein